MNSILRWCALAAGIATGFAAPAQNRDAAAAASDLTIKFEDVAGANVLEGDLNPLTLKLTDIPWKDFKTEPPSPEGLGDRLSSPSWRPIAFRVDLQTDAGPHSLVAPVASERGAISRLGKDDSDPLIAILFVAKTGEGQKLVFGFGPDNVKRAAVTAELIEPNTVGWSSLRLKQNGADDKNATFRYEESLSRFPYVVLCREVCTEEQLADVRGLLRNAGLAPVLRTAVTEERAPEPVSPRLQTRRLRVVVVPHEDSRFVRPFFAKLATDCEGRSGAGEAAEIGNQEATIALPVGVGPTACLLFSDDREKLEDDTPCFVVRTDIDLQISTRFLESPPLPCRVPTESVDVEFSIISLNDSTPAAANEVGPGEKLRRIEDLAGGVTIAGNRLFGPTVRLPRSLLREDSEVSVDFQRPGVFSVSKHRIIGKGAEKKVLEIELREDFARLGSVVFAPVDSNGQFENQCLPVVSVPHGARLDKRAWDQAQMGHADRFDNGRVRMVSRERAYRVPTELSDLPLLIGEGGSEIRIEFVDTICRAGEIKVTPEALRGIPLSPIVRQAAPFFFVFATGTHESAKEVGLSPALETNFWQASLELAGHLESVDERKSRFDATRLEFALNQMNASVVLGESSARPLFSSGAVRSLANSLYEEANTSRPENFVLDVANDLRNRIQDIPAVVGEEAPSSRILLIGPQLGWKRAVCSKFGSAAKSLAEWLKGGGARLATIEIVDDERSEEPGSLIPTETEHLFQCNTHEVWQGVSRSYVIHADGLVGGHRSGVFDAIQADLQAFFAIDDMGVGQ